VEEDDPPKNNKRSSLDHLAFFLICEGPYNALEMCRIICRACAAAVKSMVAKKLAVSGSEKGGLGYVWNSS
jgi:hypothetical protein